MKRSSLVERNTKETKVGVELDLDGSGKCDIQTGIPFFDHMLTLFTVHGLFDLKIQASGDIDVDFHHTVEDVGLVLGTAIDEALGDRKGICRYGHAVTPMDETLAEVSLDLSNRPYLVYNLPGPLGDGGRFDKSLAKEFFRAYATKAGMNLHINIRYGENEHHIIEAVFKSAGRALNKAVSYDPRIKGIPSSKGAL